MIRYDCIFKGGSVGYLEVIDPVNSDEKKCWFMPYRSKAHLRLTKLVKNNKKPVIILKSEQHTVEAEVINIMKDSIIVKKREVTNKNSFVRKILSFLRK